MIRKVKNADIPEIEILMKSEPGYWHEDWRHDVLERAINSTYALGFVWEEKGRIIAFSCAHDLGFLAYLSVLIVNDEARNKGIGRALIQHVQNELANRGCTVLIADVWNEAVEFYKSLGWSSPDVVLLRKRLLIQG